MAPCRFQEQRYSFSCCTEKSNITRDMHSDIMRIYYNRTMLYATRGLKLNQVGVSMKVFSALHISKITLSPILTKGNMITFPYLSRH